MLTKIYQSTGGYLGGLALICLVNAALTTIFLAIDGVPFFLPLGILSGLSSMVPYAGPFLAGTGISLIALFTAGTWHGIAAGIYFIVYGQIEGNILGPLIFRGEASPPTRLRSKRSNASPELRGDSPVRLRKNAEN